MEMWLLSLYLQYSWVCFIFPDISVGHMCRVSNIQIDNEEGKQQFIELNLKKVDIDDISSCPGPGCSFHDEYNKFGEYHYSQWISSPPTFNLVFTPGELILECDTDASLALTPGLCATNEAEKGSCANDVCSLHDIEESVETIEDKQLLQLLTGDETLDHRVATAIVLLNLGNIDKAIEQFTSVIANDPTAAMAYFGRGVAYARKGLQSQGIAQKALNDFHKAIDLDTGQTRPDMYIHRAEMFLMMHRYQEAYNDATTALKLKPLPKIYFLRGVISLLMENFSLAEQDFRKNVQSPDESIRIMSHFHLGLALYYRGKVRNAVEVFKEVIKENPDHLGAVLSLAQGFKELSNVRGALARFNQSLLIQPNNTMVYNLRGNLLFTTGEHQAAILDYENCVSGDPYNANCQYMKAASKIILGQFYEGLKDTTKLMVSNIPVIKASPEHVKAHYLREYARYVHARLDGPISLIQPDMDFSPDYLDHWVKLKKFDIKNYKEQPGLQPDIRDVQSLTDVSPDLESLLCRAEALGRLSQVSVDGIVPDKRLNLAMGLASLHVAQYFEAKWKILKTKTGTQEKVVNSWKELFSIAVYYRRLANLEQPYLWVNMLPSYTSKEGHRTDIPFVRGSVHNMKVTPYNELAFKLAKTMLEHYSGDGAASYSGLKEDLAKATSCEDLLAVARKRQINPRGFLVSTQVPSVAGVREDNRLEGGILVLTEDQHQKIVFALNIVNMPDRMSSYHSEMDYLLMLLQDEMRKSGLSKASDVDVIISHILSIAYYFYNLIPLSKGSSSYDWCLVVRYVRWTVFGLLDDPCPLPSPFILWEVWTRNAVAYSVLLGLIMSVGRQITGRIPNGRLLDMEAIFAGAPDAFVMVAKNWMQIKKISVPVSSLPKVSELLPTVRSVLEVLSFNSTTCLH